MAKKQKREEVQVDIAQSSKDVKKKSSGISFDIPVYECFKHILSPDMKAKVTRLAQGLHVLEDQHELFMSVMGYTLCVAKDRSGLPEDRFSGEAKAALDFADMDEYLIEAIAQQDLLHAPARTRAQQAVANTVIGNGGCCCSIG